MSFGPRSLLYPELPRRVPSPPILGGEAQVRGCSQHEKNRSQKGAFFKGQRLWISTSKTSLPPLTPSPLPASGAKENVFWPLFAEIIRPSFELTSGSSKTPRPITPHFLLATALPLHTNCRALRRPSAVITAGFRAATMKSTWFCHCMGRREASPPTWRR